MKVLVTGGAGFIGSHLVEELIEGGADVHVIDNLSTGFAENVHLQARLHIMDIRSEQAVEMIRSIKPDVVFHHAALVDVQRSIKEPYVDAEINIIGTIHVLEACRQAGVRKIIYPSSCAVYGNSPGEFAFEKDIPQPISNYGLSKLTPEWYIRVYHQLYGLSYTILRYSNVYGSRQTPKGEGGVVAIFLDRIKNNLPLTLFGDGEQTRDFIYVKDVVRANIQAIFEGNEQIINVSTAVRTTINQLASQLLNIHRFNIDLVYASERPGDIRHSCLHNGKAKDFLKWHPQYDVYHGLLETYRFCINATKR